MTCYQMLVTFIRDIGNLLKMFVTSQVYEILNVLGFLYKFVLWNEKENSYVL